MAVSAILGAIGQGIQSGIGALNSQVSQGNSYGYNGGNSWQESYGGSNNFNRTFGTEATALQMQLAQEANALQRELYEDAKSFNAQEAQKNREFQERLANTAIRRQVEDLKAAGINPILAANYMGAASPSGAQASTGMAQAYMANVTPESIGGGSSSNYGHSGSDTWGENVSSNESRSWLHDIAEAGSELLGLNKNDAKKVIQNPGLINTLNVLYEAGKRDTTGQVKHGGGGRSF